MVCIAHIEIARLDDMQEVGHRELSVSVHAVIPDVPYEERPDGAGEFFEILLYVEDDTVVECHGHAYVMERWRVALHVLDGVGIGVEDKRVPVYLS